MLFDYAGWFGDLIEVVCVCVCVLITMFGIDQSWLILSLCIVVV